MKTLRIGTPEGVFDSPFGGELPPLVQMIRSQGYFLTDGLYVPVESITFIALTDSDRTSVANLHMSAEGGRA